MNERALAALALGCVLGWMAFGAAAAAPTAGTPDGGSDLDAGQSTNGTRLVYGGDSLALQSGPGQAVRGRTDRAPGTVLTVRLRSNGERPFLRSTTTTVDGDGAFRATFDLSEVPPGTGLRVVVHRNGSNLAAAAAEVVECSDDCPSATPVAPSAVVTDDGDGLALRTRPGQPIRGRTNLPPGTELGVQLRSAGGATPFVVRQPTTVDGNGTFRAVFDLDDVAGTADVRIAVRHDGTTLTTTRATVTCPDCEPPETAGGGGGDGNGYAGADVGVVQVRNGSVARVRIALGGADAATLSVGGPGTDYALDATVRDGTGDGEVVVLFDTSAAATGERTVRTASANDEVAVTVERGTFAATEYRVALHPVGNESATVATGLLVVAQDGESETPLFTAVPDSARTPALGGVLALLVGVGLGVLGLGSLLGLVDLRGLLSGR